MAKGTVNVGNGRDNKDSYVTNETIGVPGGLATLDANGKLTVSQRPAIDHYTQAETDGRITDAVAAHNSSTSAHGDIRSLISELFTSLQALELKYGTSVTANPFSVTFTSLDGLVVTGVWNADLARIEF